MTGVIALLVGSVVVGWQSHRGLLWLAERRVDATVLLTGWVLSTVGLVVSLLATISMLALPADEHPSSGMFRLAGGCLAAISSGSFPGWREALAAVGVAGTAGLLGRLGWAIAMQLRGRRQCALHVEQLRLLAAGAPADEPLWVREDRPLAVSISGRPGLIVMSDGLRRHLTPAALAATLEHERAHLRGRHHALVSLAETLARALPAVPLLNAAPRAVKDLVELAADAQAARRCSPEAVHDALCRLAGHPKPSFGLAMAGRLIETRLTRLTTGTVGGNRPLRVLGCLVVAAGALLLPLATGWLALNVVGCVVA